jgi:hypothetical protein
VFASEDLLTRVVMKRMLAGVATRRHANLGGAPRRGAGGPGRGHLSLGRLPALRPGHQAGLGELMARDLSDLATRVIMIEGIEVARQCLVAALVITTDGRKIPVGLYLGDTENATVVTDLQKHGRICHRARSKAFKGGRLSLVFFMLTDPSPIGFRIGRSGDEGIQDHCRSDLRGSTT